MNVVLSVLQDGWGERIGWTLVHSIWQVAVIAAAFAMMSFLLRRRSANARYALGCTTLLVMVAAPVATFVGWRGLPPEWTSVRATSQTAPKVVSEKDTVAVVPLATAAPPVVRSAPPQFKTGFDSSTIIGSEAAISWRERLQQSLPWLSAAWLVGVVLFSLRPLMGLAVVHRLKSRGLAPLSAELHQVAGRLLADLGVRRTVQFAESMLVQVPTVVGYLRPMILLPASAVTGLSGEQLELVLAHELAHVRRHDYLVNLLQTVIEALLFYHPGMWWVSASARRERENCCDDVAVACCGNRGTYIRALWAMERYRATDAIAGLSGGAVPPALAATGGSLLQRVRRLIGRQNEEPGLRRRGAWLAGLLTLLLVASLLAVGRTVAQPDVIAAENNLPSGQEADPTVEPDIDLTPPTAPTASTAVEPGDAPLEAPDSRQRLVGRWVSGGIAPIVHTYEADGTYTIEVLGETGRGTWRLEDEQLTIKIENGALKGTSSGPIRWSGADSFSMYHDRKWWGRTRLDPKRGMPREGVPTTFIGRIIYDGPPPEPKRLRIPLTITYWNGEKWVDTPELPERRRIHELGLKDESLLVGEDGGIANVVVWARSKEIPAPPWNGPLPPSTIRAKDGRFEPHVLAFWNAAPLRWVNDTDGGVNFQWTPVRANAANRMLVQGQEIEFEVKLRRAEPFPVALTCNIHPWLRAFILPLSHPYFAVTGPDGRFEIKNLPLGEWEFAMWHERTGWLKTDRFLTGRFRLKIERGDNVLGDLRVEPRTLAEQTQGPAEPSKSNHSAAAKVQQQQQPDRNKPWVAVGRVTDASGKPMPGVEVKAFAGVATLRNTGTTTTDANGNYRLEFGPGILFMDSPKALQAATISASKPGYFEQNLNRQGGCVAGYERPDEGDDLWGHTPEKVFLPGEPKTLNFVMLPAAVLEGEFVETSHNWNVREQSFYLVGEELPPSSSVLRSVTTDRRGRFRVDAIPTGREWRIGMRVPHTGVDIQTDPLRFDQPGVFRCKLLLETKAGESGSVQMSLRVDDLHLATPMVGE